MVESHLVEGNQSPRAGSRWPTVRASLMPASAGRYRCSVTSTGECSKSASRVSLIVGCAVRVAYPMNHRSPDRRAASHQAMCSIVSNDKQKSDSLAVGFLIFKRMTFTSLYPVRNGCCFRRDLVSITQIIAFNGLKFSSNSYTSGTPVGIFAQESLLRSCYRDISPAHVTSTVCGDDYALTALHTRQNGFIQ